MVAFDTVEWLIVGVKRPELLKQFGPGCPRMLIEVTRTKENINHPSANRRTGNCSLKFDGKTYETQNSRYSIIRIG